jgi:hypothetical protein
MVTSDCLDIHQGSAEQAQQKRVISQAATGSPTRLLLALILFGVSFGYVEAAMVVYLRALYAPLHEQLHPGRLASDLFPLIRLDQLQAAGPEAMHWLSTELIREFATLVMLAAVAWTAAARDFRQWLAGFMIAFGIWDIFYYAFLKLLLGWPESLLTWDLLFLLPVPWAGPVLAPVLVALSMVLAGATVVYMERGSRPELITWRQWLCIITGGVMIVLAFCWDFRNLLDGGEPNPFNWPLFVFGLTIGMIGFLIALCRGRRTSPPVQSFSRPL